MALLQNEIDALVENAKWTADLEFESLTPESRVPGRWNHDGDEPWHALEVPLRNRGRVWESMLF